MRYASTPAFQTRKSISWGPYMRVGLAITPPVLLLTLVALTAWLPFVGGRTISWIAFEVGFNDVSYFNRSFRKRFAMTPGDARHAPPGIRRPDRLTLT